MANENEKTTQVKSTICECCGQVIEDESLLTNVIVERGGLTERWCDECVKAHAVKCEKCGEYVEECIATTVKNLDGDGAEYCPDCLEELEEAGEVSQCERCHGWFTNLGTVFVVVDGDCEEQAWCDDCTENHAVQCVCCEEYFSDDRETRQLYFTDTDGETLCDDCRGQGYDVCEDCERVTSDYDGSYREEYDVYLCDTCYQDRLDNDTCDDYDDDEYPVTHRVNGRTIIHDYHSYPNNPWQHYSLVTRNGIKVKNFSNFAIRRKFLHIGRELEIIGAGENAENALKITTAFGFPADESEMLICSHDGSLCQDGGGFEIITQPMTTEAFYEIINVKAGLKKARDLNYVSHNGGWCGLHFHVDRVYFEGAMESPEKALCLLFANNEAWLRLFSRRQNWNYCAMYSSRTGNGMTSFSYEDFKGKDVVAIEEALRKINDMVRVYRDGGHGVALNFYGHSTIEFRLFRGSLKYETIRASEELVNMMCYAAKHYRLEQLTTINFRWFKNFAKRKGYTDFITYCDGLRITK